MSQCNEAFEVIAIWKGTVWQWLRQVSLTDLINML